MRRRWISWLVLLAASVPGFASPARAGFLNGVTSRDGVDVIAVGDSGMIYRSVDGGVVTSKTYRGTQSLRAVAARGLTILIAGDNGVIWRSTNNGISWSQTIVAGTPRLLGVEMPPGSSNAFVVGAGGTLLRSIDDGANWSPLSPGTGGTIRALRFTDGSNGWIVGDNGFVASTIDGGDNWTPGGVPTTNHLYGVDFLGSRVWIVGALGTCFKSTTGGSAWTQLDLKMDSRSEVRAVALQGADSVFIAGGGGFIRRSVDDGSTWTFLQHSLYGEVSDVQAVGARLWVTSIRSPAVLRSFDRGETWLLSTGTNIVRNWSLRQGIVVGSARGNSIAPHPVYRNGMYAAVGSRFYVSRDDGDSWTQFAQLPPGFTKVNAFLVNPKDSLSMTCAASNPQMILHSNNGGATWDTSLVKLFGEYGIPLEMNPDKTDTLLFAPDNSVIYRSLDFGKTWAAYGSKIFRSPCDMIIVPESDSNAVLLGDGITGSGVGELWRSTDGGVTFTKHYTTTGSEIPGMSMGRLRNTRAFATNWSIGGVERSLDTGLNWTQVQTTSAGWGTDVCDDDPNVVVYGVYSGGLGYLSQDGGTSYVNAALSGSNYSFYARDRNCIIANQGGGIYKLYTSYVFAPTGFQSSLVVAPNGGDNWASGTVHDIRWNSANIVMAKIEYQISPTDPWILVAEVPGYYGKYSWTVPADPTVTAMVRVSDAFDGSPADISDSYFTIATPIIANSPGYLDYGDRPMGYTARDSVTITNTGTATLHVTSITTGTGDFVATPLSLTLAPEASARIYVDFLPVAEQHYSDVLTIVSDSWTRPNLVLTLTGTGTDTLPVDLLTPDGGEQFQYGTTQKVAWTTSVIPNVDIEYRTGPFQPWIPIATGLSGPAGSYSWVIPDAPTTEARVRVRETGGTSEDLSVADFAITVPRFLARPFDVVDLGPVLMGDSRTDTLRIENHGTAPLTISSATVDRPTFRLGRSSLVIPAFLSDTLSITYEPEATARDSATLTLVADDPGGPHTLKVAGFGTLVTGVGDGLPAGFGLWQNQPNPFRGLTRIRYALPRRSHVALDVFNLAGQRVTTLLNQEQGPGEYTLEFEPWRAGRGAALPSGVYFYRFRAGEFTATRKMLLMK